MFGGLISAEARNCLCIVDPHRLRVRGIALRHLPGALRTALWVGAGLSGLQHDVFRQGSGRWHRDNSLKCDPARVQLGWVLPILCWYDFGKPGDTWCVPL